MRKAVGRIVVSVALVVGLMSSVAPSALADGLPASFLDPTRAIGHSGGMETWTEAIAQPASAPEGDRVLYHGGDVLYEPHVYVIFMGSNWNIPAYSGIRSQLQNLYQEISGSAWQGILTQYFGKEGIVSNSVASTFYTDASVQFSNAFYSEINAEAAKVAKAQGWNLSPANDQVIALTSPGTFSGPGQAGLCAEHSTQTINGVNVSYSIVPYQGDSIFANCLEYGYGDPVKATSMAASHEYAESISDPFGGGWAGLKHEEEVADLCVNSRAQQLPTGGWVNELWDNVQGRCSLSDPNPPALHGVTLNSTGITTTEATLHGKVNPGGLEASYYFEYGTSQLTYGTKVPVSPVSIGSGTADVEVSQAATGLKPGTVYHWRVTVTNPRGTTHGHDATFTTEGPPVIKTESATGTQKTSTTLNGTVNPNGKATSYYFEYGPTTAYGSKTAEVNVGSGVEGVHASAEITGLNPKTFYNFRLVATNSYGTAVGGNLGVTTKSSPPVVVTGTADGISASKAVVHGTVNPEGFETTYFFEYGETSYGSKTAEVNLEAGTSPIEVSATLPGLKEGTQYQYRLFATSSQGSVTDFSVDTFTTLKLPTAKTEPATELESSLPRLNATINPNGRATRYQFEYGPTVAYGSTIPIIPVAAGSGTSPVAVSKILSGLKARTTYHFRVVAESDAGSAYGADQAFTTIPTPQWWNCAKQAGGRFSSGSCATEGAPNAWELLRLKEGEKTTIVARGTSTTFSTIQSGISTPFTCQTEVLSPSLENPSGGGNGVGSGEVKYKSCKPEGVWSEKGCKVENTASAVTRLELVVIEGKIRVQLTPKEAESFATFTISGCAGSKALEALNGAWKLTGWAYGPYSNAATKIDLSAETTTALKLRGQSVSVVGSIVLETTGGGYVSAQATALLHWQACAKQGGGKYASGTCTAEGVPNEWELLQLKEAEKTTITAKGNPITFSSIQGGMSTPFTCETEVASPSLENPSGGGNGVGSGEVKYKGCKAEGAWGEKGCKVENTASPVTRLELALIESKAEVKLTPKEGESFATFTVSGCAGSKALEALNGAWKLTGSAYGLYSNASSKIELSSATTTGLKLRNQNTTAVGSLGLETTGGGYVRAE